MEQGNGKIVQIQGGVVDVEFSAGDIPDIYEALHVIQSEDNSIIVLEVEKDLGNNWVRCVSMSSTG